MFSLENSELTDVLLDRHNNDVTFQDELREVYTGDSFVEQMQDWGNTDLGTQIMIE
ncbi:hypothetical protein AArcS_2694 [Natranaeroarchaeum sulfidigenes]|uniref:Uncharacterized protein n=1 Tax=Natranaeroarchaeum sulfidigenes TaxID=2784880 RepID=A0A897MNZ5_9EURY|nr:hypothetical protein AArcS_2694 [Natranaeroarchaeum sulfidigenes]